MDWIKIEDQKPPPSKRVLFCVYMTSKDKHELHTGYLHQSGSFYIVGGRFSFDIGKIIEWQPLPYHEKVE